MRGARPAGRGRPPAWAVPRCALGNGEVTQDTLRAQSGQLAAWGDALGDDADILFYGCNVAEGEIGEAFVAVLAELTGADIAASDDVTGASSQDGDWEFEHASGPIEAAVPFKEEAVASFDQILANPVINNLAGDSATTFTGIAVLVDVGGDASVSDADNPPSFNQGEFLVKLGSGKTSTETLAFTETLCIF